MMAVAGDTSRRSGWIALGLLIPCVSLVAYLVACALAVSALITPQRKLTNTSPAELGFAGAQPLSFVSESDDVVLRGWLVPADSERAIVLIHGIHSNAWDCQAPDVVRAYIDAGFSVLLFDLRGHGDSDGEHAGLGLLERHDVAAAVALLRHRGFRDGNIGVHGTSYGAAIALMAAAQIPEVGAVVADSAFADIRDVVGGELQREIQLPARVADLLMPGMSWLAHALYSLPLEQAAPERVIESISPRRILLIHGEQDSVIPFEHARRLKAAAGSIAELWPIPGNHTQGVRMAPSCQEPAPTRAAFLAKVVEFFERNLR